MTPPTIRQIFQRRWKEKENIKFYINKEKIFKWNVLEAAYGIEDALIPHPGSQKKNKDKEIKEYK